MSDREAQEREAVQWFSGQMLQKLRENQHKGDWQSMTVIELYAELYGEFTELMEALKKHEPEEIVRECADVANYAMFIADKIRKKEEHD